MSDKLPETNNSEEVDLGQLFNVIRKLFEGLFNFVKSIFIGAFKLIIYALKPIVYNFKAFVIIMFTAFVLGFALDKVLEPVYLSQMLVQPHFQSKYKLADNVDYFNALIEAKNINELSNIFEIDSSDAVSLIKFRLDVGPETPNDLLIEYNEYVNSLDSVIASTTDYDNYVENRDILGGSIFSIEAKAKKKDVFVKLERGFEKTFENPYSKKLKTIRDSTIQIQKETYNKELIRLDSLQRIYLTVIQNESEKENTSSLSSESSVFPLQLERIPTKEYELFQKELEIRNEIRALDEELIEESVFYDILSGFEEIGSKETSLLSKYKLTIPLLVFLLMAVTYLSNEAFKFIRDYEE